MRLVQEAWPEAVASVEQLVGQVPQGHHLVLLGEVDAVELQTEKAARIEAATAINPKELGYGE